MCRVTLEQSQEKEVARQPEAGSDTFKTTICSHLERACFTWIGHCSGHFLILFLTI
jgi:hypothetical protein